jgi:hypothetical protein
MSKHKFEDAELSELQVMFREDLKVKRNRIDKAKKEYKRLRATCQHVISPKMTEELKALLNSDNKKDWTEQWKYDAAVCDICEVHFGFRCTKSPDTVCHYELKDHTVTLVNGQPFELSDAQKENFEPDYHNEDSCVFCWSPRERK